MSDAVRLTREQIDSITSEQAKAAKAKHRAEGCECGGYFYADALSVSVPGTTEGVHP